MSFLRSAASALAAGSAAAAVIFALVVRTPVPHGVDDGTRLPRFAVFVSAASTRLLEDPAITGQLELVALTSPDGIEQQMERLDADGVILDSQTATQMTAAGLLSLLKSSRVVVALGVPTWEVQRLAGLGSLATPAPKIEWPRPFFSVLLYWEDGSSGTIMDYSTRTFTGLLTRRASERAQVGQSQSTRPPGSP